MRAAAAAALPRPGPGTPTRARRTHSGRPHAMQAQSNASFAITPCNATAFCGHGTPVGSGAEYACQHIALPANASADALAAARQALLSLYPASIDVLLQVGRWVGGWGARVPWRRHTPPGAVCEHHRGVQPQACTKLPRVRSCLRAGRGAAGGD